MIVVLAYLGLAQAALPSLHSTQVRQNANGGPPVFRLEIRIGATKTRLADLTLGGGGSPAPGDLLRLKYPKGTFAASTFWWAGAGTDFALTKTSKHILVKTRWTQEESPNFGKWETFATFDYAGNLLDGYTVFGATGVFQTKTKQGPETITLTPTTGAWSHGGSGELMIINPKKGEFWVCDPEGTTEIFRVDFSNQNRGRTLKATRSGGGSATFTRVK